MHVLVVQVKKAVTCIGRKILWPIYLQGDINYGQLIVNCVHDLSRALCNRYEIISNILPIPLGLLL